MGIVFTRGRARSIFVIVLALATALTMALAIDEAAATGINHGDVVEEVPRTNTPEFLDDEVRGHLQVGNRIIVGGGFTQVRDDTFGVVNQPYLAAYDIATGRLDMAFRPELSGPVFSLADAGDGTIIAVGKFTTVNGKSRKRVVKLDVVDGSVVTAFKANATATVNDVVVAGNRVYFGGGFAQVNGTAREKLAAVDLQTGAVASNFNFPVTEETGYWIDGDPNNRAGAVRALDVTPDGKKLLVVHNSRKVGGQARQSVALIDIDGAPSLLPWQTDNYDYDCQPWFESFIRPLMRDAQFSPDGSYFVAVSSLGNFAPGCDVAVRFPTAGGNGVNPTWVSRLFDTPEAVAVTDEAIYVGGHMRWLQKPGTVWTDWGNGNTDDPPNTAARQQIGALNIANGTALPWDPGASGHRGVLALEATPVGLLAGSDGERFGGRTTYRHALFELPSTTPPNDTSAPNGSLTMPANGQVYNGRVTVTGNASDNRGVAEVYVVVKNTGTNKYLQPDLTWATGRARLPSFVHEYQATATAFGWSGDLPNGNYTVTVRAKDIVGNIDGSPATRSFVVTSGTDTVAPNGTLDVPTPDQGFATNSVAMSGSATDNVAVAEVNLIIKDQETGNYLQDNGTTWGAWNAVPASLTAPNNPATDWDWNGTLPESNFEVRVQVKDLAGNKDPAKASATFRVDTTDPNGAFKKPKKDQTLTSRKMRFKGRATDNLGVGFVRLIVKDTTTGKYLHPDGTWKTKKAKLPRVTLADPGGTDTTWTFTRNLKKDGNFKVLAHVVDKAGNKDPQRAKRRFSIVTN